jgi:hypothetical protein
VGVIATLLSGAVDYAGLFPPAGLDLDRAIANCREYRRGSHSWMLGRFIVPASRVQEVPEDFAVAVIEKDPAREVIPDGPVYYEGPVPPGGRAKIRTGGVTPDAFPPVERVAEFLESCRASGLAFKATAGLHHAIRGRYRVTYEPDSARAPMHGFLNVLVAACFVFSGKGHAREILAEEDPTAFRFDAEHAWWKDHRVTGEQVRAAREEFVISFGSCSFAEPVEDLRKLNLLA